MAKPSQETIVVIGCIGTVISAGPDRTRPPSLLEKSVMRSCPCPCANTKRSASAPPSRVSSPYPAFRVSSPSRPRKWPSQLRNEDHQLGVESISRSACAEPSMLLKPTSESLIRNGSVENEFDVPKHGFTMRFRGSPGGLSV